MKEGFTPEEENNTTSVQPEVNSQVTEPVQPETVQQPSETTQPEVNTQPTEPVQPYTATTVQQQSQPVEQAPLEMPNNEPKKKKSKLPVLIFIIVILGALCGGSYYFLVANTDNPIYDFFFNKNGNGGTVTTTTAAKLTEEEAKKLSLELIQKYKEDDYASDDTACFGSSFEDVENEELAKIDNPCNGVYEASKKFKTIDETKKYLNELLTESNTDKVAKKFIEKDNYIWCCVPATELSYIKNDSFEINSITVNEKEITAEYKYISEFAEGGEDSNGNQGSYITSTEVTYKIVIKNEDNKWKVDSNTYISQKDLGERFETD